MGNDTFNISKGSSNLANKNLNHNSSNNPHNPPNGTAQINATIPMQQGFGNNVRTNGGIGDIIMEISSSNTIIFNRDSVKIYEIL
ncbi:hypothetical protein [Methanobacterium spitsbergense]|uniref:Uncharacterized protein n=1 Tax=Methanobacterium spitsbergense TaxID=2874285 RepID=A0A8T5V039_9EURY|nr:hypothetical protein [Methanobacterium spitsbergense]MBZ2166820.1 hypothetical protein [Methanobacterium spitsbergense]